MKKVYIISEYEPYGGGYIIGVYTNKKKAEKDLRAYVAMETYPYYVLETYEVTQ